MITKLKRVIDVNEDNCINCHACVYACPSKYCNDFTTGHASINPDLCVGCGSCIFACKHNARFGVDDFDEFMQSVKKSDKIVAIVAPAISANFPNKYLKFNGFLKSLGIKAIFDTSFGAELTVKSYLEYVKKYKPKIVIAQPCPALVTFLEIYDPDALKYLAPADSPMLHTMKMVKEYYKEYKDYKFVVVSPCLAKRREFDEVGIGDFNVTINSFDKYLAENGINLNKYQEVDFDNPPAERAVLFSSPGGLMRTAERENPALIKKARKIEGIHSVYEYLQILPEMIKKGYNPLLIDCLSCEKGCNGGPGTVNIEKPIDEIEYFVEQRNLYLQKKYSSNFDDKKAKKNVNKIINKYWKENLYNRNYKDLSANLKEIRLPNNEELQEVYHKMNKVSEDDFLNCAYCGYKSCEKMAIAIFNELNLPENCVFYKQSLLNMESEKRKEVAQRLTTAVKEMDEIGSAFIKMSSEFLDLAESIENQVVTIEQSNSTVKTMIFSTKIIADTINEKKQLSDKLFEVTTKGAKKVKNTNRTIKDISKSVGDVQDTIRLIDDISSRTNLLAMNAAIEAAHAGQAGKGFAVVSGEIRRLAELTSNNSAKIGQTLKMMIDNIEIALETSEENESVLKQINDGVIEFTSSLNEISSNMNELVNGTNETLNVLENLSKMTKHVKENTDEMKEDFSDIKNVMDTVKRISNNILNELSKITFDLEKLKT